MLKQILIQCSSQVKRNAVVRKIIDGVEHIIISSMTMPDDVVMNGVLYPAEEIAKSFPSLERTLAPVEHPADADGNFLSATDPTAIHNFYAGAYNENVRQVDGRIAIDKVINVQEAMKSEKGKRLLERVEELENNADARPIHTSTGVFLDVEVLNVTQKNTRGDEFTAIARNMVFDHDAILLDSIGAAQPHQGVGMAVNGKRKDIEVQRVELTLNAHGEMSVDMLREALRDAISKDPIGQLADWVHIEDIFPDRVIFSAGDNLFAADYVLDATGLATLVSLPLPVSREITYEPKTNNQQEDAMKELMLAALAAASVTVNAEISDADLLLKYNELLAAQNKKGEPAPVDDPAGGDAVAAAVTNAVKPLLDKVESLETKLNAKDGKELDDLATLVGNSDKYPGLDVDACKKLDVETLKGMAANCQTSFGLPMHANQGGSNEGASHSYDMPK